jgi:hypothetical protein
MRIIEWALSRASRVLCADVTTARTPFGWVPVELTKYEPDELSISCARFVARVSVPLQLTSAISFATEVLPLVE